VVCLRVEEGRKDTKILYRVLRLALILTAKLPLGALHAAGALLGWLIYWAAPGYRRRLRANLAEAGYRDARTRREAIAAAGKMLAELPAVWLRPPERVAALVRSVEGAGEALAAIGTGQPLLFLTPHLGCFEITAQYAARGGPLTVLYRPPKLGWLDPLMREGRDRGNLRLAPANLSGVRELFAALKRGEAVGLLPDHVPGEGEGEWAQYFGRQAYTMTLAARLASRESIACYLIYARRLPRGRGFALVLRPLPPALPGERPTGRLNRAIEGLVRECPGQYLWSYNRYKTPAGARPPEDTMGEPSR
jgi:KDO2-lipid IV(A) lauroyltransferase